MSIDHGKLLALADRMERHAERLPAEAAKMLRHYIAALRALAQPAEAREYCPCMKEDCPKCYAIQPAEAVEGREPVVWRVPTKYGISYSFASEELMRELCGPAEAVEHIIWPAEAYITGASPENTTDAAQGAVAPFRDFAGNVIRDKDRIKHPDGTTGTVLHLPAMQSDPWRVVYETGVMSRLNLQVGDKGQAVVVHPQAAPAQGDGWKLVPVEATEEMRAAFAIAAGDTRILGAKEQFRIAYAKLLAAAPSQEGE